MLTMVACKLVKAYAYNLMITVLFCMVGILQSGTSNALIEAAYDFQHDLNADYTYEAKDSDPPTLKEKNNKRWFMERCSLLHNGTRIFEYQDTAKCYIGFRNVISYLETQPKNNRRI